ncbi:hypothetical protein [Burkholderia gladioli]|uniref:hypothetical protein n=1 Tax=Burkholderia gladioli TaxID=28095 RepID=UPI003EE368F3
MSACNNSHESASSAQGGQPQNEQAASVTIGSEAAPTKQDAPVTPSHQYVLEQDGEYGYQPAISEEDARQGVATKALVMVRYRGKKDGAYVVEVNNDTGATLRVQCKNPCEYVRTQAIVDGQVIHTETLANAPDSVIYAVLEDARNGQLKPYKR